MPPARSPNMSSVLKRLVGAHWMERLIRTAARMVNRPPTERIQPSLLLPSKKRTPMPIRSGSMVRPKPAGRFQPQSPKKENEDETCTWLRTRYPPTTVQRSPKKNVPTPPGVPPAPRSRRPRMSAFASSSSSSSAVCLGASMLGMDASYRGSANVEVSRGSTTVQDLLQSPARFAELGRRKLAIHWIEPEDLAGALAQGRR